MMDPEPNRHIMSQQTRQPLPEPVPLTALINLASVRFSWPQAPTPTIDIEQLTLAAGERAFLRGPSGSGKTTLLSLVAAVIAPDEGLIEIAGTDLATLKGAARDRFRADHMGLVFQQFNLLPFLSVAQNVTLPCRFSTARRARAEADSGSLDAEVHRLLRALKLDADTLLHRPAMSLSVGQQQRVAVARALIGRPPLVIADEPTSALDTDTRDAFLDLLFNEIKTTGASLLFVSHDRGLATRFDRQLDLPSLNRADASQPDIANPDR